MASDRLKAEGWIVVHEFKASGCSVPSAQSCEILPSTSLTAEPRLGEATYLSAGQSMNLDQNPDMSAQRFASVLMSVDVVADF